MDVLAEVSTPLGDGALLFYKMQAEEAISQPFGWQLELLSESADVAFDQLIGQGIGVALQVPDAKRHFHGLVTRFELTGRHGRYFRYEATVRPWLWVLTRTQDCRIFQEKSTLEIVKEVFEDHSVAVFEDRTTGSYDKWEYCVQYRETDFQFISRLLEHEGIYYFFEHKEGQHTLVLADGAPAHKKTPGYESLPFIEIEGDERTDREAVRTWRMSEEMQPGKTAIEDYDFERPSVDLLQQRASPRTHDHAEEEVFDYPGEYTQAERGEQFVRTRLEELQCRYRTARGTADARGVTCGAIFNLTGFDREDQNIGYLITRTNIEVLQADPESTLSVGSSFQCRFESIAADEPFRPARSTRKPVVRGPQTAVVVGPDGDEIYTDKYGRVKVQFHWDRYGQRDANSSCWVRVSQPWAGKNYGFMAIPRIGQEVIVDFLEGDPNRPIITGRVYNAEQMPPWDLPGQASVMGMKSDSTKGRGGYNEMSFDDTKGKEKITIHGQYDMATTVLHDQTLNVSNNRTDTIGVDDSETVGSNQTQSIGANQSISVGANRSETVGGTETITITGHRTETVNGGETVTVNGGRSHTVNGVQTTTISAAEVHSVGAGRMHNVGAAEAVSVGGAQAVSVGGAQMVSVGGVQKVNVGALQSVSVGGPHKLSAAAIQQTSKGVFQIKASGTAMIEAPTIVLKAGGSKITLNSSGVTIKASKVTIKGSGGVAINSGGSVKIKGSTIGEN